MFRSLLIGCLVAVCPTIAPANEWPLEQALRGTFRMTNGTQSGTAFIVAEHGADAKPAKAWIVTAAHVLENFAGEKCTLIMRKANGDGGYARHDVAVAIREQDKPLWSRHEKLDVAALPFSIPEGVNCVPFKLAHVVDADFVAAGKLRVGQQVYVPCYPAQLAANDAGWPVLRSGTIATHPLAPVDKAQTILIDYSHFGGDSGAPVVMLVDNLPQVVGLVYSMNRQTDKATLPFEERTMHTPLGLANAVQAQIIRDTIAKLAQ